MREIIFKAKRTDTGEWVEGYPFPSIVGKSLNRMTVFEPFPGGTVVNTYDVDPETVGQYTGLTDKNEKKIFEGERIRFVTWEKDVMERAVFWDQEHGRFCVWLNGAVTVGVNRYLSEDIEVIGNIHDKEEMK